LTKRTREHALETESLTNFEALVPSNWVFRRKSYDYGIDGELEIFDDTGNATGLIIFVQLKSTDSKEINKCLTEHIKVDTLKYFLKLEYPVLILKYSKHFNKIYYMWAHSKLRCSIRENQKTTTIHFSDANTLRIESFPVLKADIINYINYHRLRIRPPFKLYLNIQSKKIVKSKILLQFKKYSELHDVCIDFCSHEDADAIGQITINEENFSLSIGGGSATVTANVADTMDEVLADINTSLAILFDVKGIVTFASKLLATVYKQSTIFNAPGMLISLLKCFYKANNFSSCLEAAKWCLTNKSELSDDFTIFCIWLLKHCNTSHNDEQIFLEQILSLPIDFYSKKNDMGKLSTSYYNLGNYYNSVNKETQALRCYNKARKTEPNYAERNYFWSDVGGILYNSGKIKCSSKAYRKSLEIKEEGDARAKYADTLIALGQYSEAQNEFKNYFESCGDKVLPFWHLKYTTLINIKQNLELADCKRDIKSAAKIFSEKNELTMNKLLKVLKKDPLNVDAWLEAGHIYHKQGDIEKTVQSYLWAALLRDTNLEAWAYVIFLSLSSITPEDREKRLFLAAIVDVAFERNGVEFLSYMDSFIENRINVSDKERFKEFWLDAYTILKTMRPLEARFIGNNKDIVKLFI